MGLKLGTAEGSELSYRRDRFHGSDYHRANRVDHEIWFVKVDPVGALVCDHLLDIVADAAQSLGRERSRFSRREDNYRDIPDWICIFHLADCVWN